MIEISVGWVCRCGRRHDHVIKTCPCGVKHGWEKREGVSSLLWKADGARRSIGFKETDNLELEEKCHP